MSGRLGIGIVVSLLACSSAPRARVSGAVDAKDLEGALEAYARLEAVDGTDVVMLGAIGALHLELAALSADVPTRDAAVAQLTLAGTAANEVLQRLSRAEAAAPVVRARALRALARRGDSQAEAMLFGLADHEDPEVAALGLSAADPEADGPRLLEALRHPSSAMRAEAALRLGEAPLGREALLELGRLARVDPEPAVRSAAVRALGSAGAAAWDPIRSRLSDPESSVRLAAIRSLVRVDRVRAQASIGSLLAGPPSPASIEAARVLAMAGEGAAEDGDSGEASGVVARAYLHAAILQAGSTLRSQAAVALVSLRPDAATDAALRAALDDEEDRMVRLGLARALLQHAGSEQEARSALEGLGAGDDMAALQTSLILSADSDAPIEALERFLDEGDALQRRVAARGLARDAGRPDLARRALGDDDPMVRVHAAGGLVAAASAA